jgi:hypothetical protein
MYEKFNALIASTFTVLGALSLTASAQAPLRNDDLSSIWSSDNGALYDLDVLKSRVVDELLPLWSSTLTIEAPGPWSQDILTCEPQRSGSIHP